MRYLFCIILIATMLCLIVGSCEKPKQTPAFELAWSDSSPEVVFVAQTELTRMGYNPGPIDSKQGPLLYEAQCRYLLDLLNGKKFETIYEGYER